MQLIECPWCGPREEVEFHYGGQAHVAVPGRTRPRCRTSSGRTTSSSATTPRAGSPSGGTTATAAAAGSTRPRHRHLPLRARLPPRRAEAGDLVTAMSLPHRRGRPHRPRHHPRVHLRRAAASPVTPATPSPRRCSPSGRHQIATSVKLGRPRGITAAWAEDSGGLVQIEEPFPEPMLLATTVELYDGLVGPRPAGSGPARGRPGLRPLRRRPPPRRRARRGRRSGRAGRRAHRGPRRGPGRPRRRAVRGRRLAALRHRRARRRSGARLGRRRGRRAGRLPGRAAPAAHHRLRQLRRRLRPRARAAHRPPRQRPAPKHLSRQRVWRFRARSIVVATGAHERPVVFADNDRPGHHARRRRPDVPEPLRRAAGPRGRRLHHQRQRLRRRPRPAPRRCPGAGRGRRPDGGAGPSARRVRASRDPGAPGKRRDRYPRRRAGHARARRPVPRRGGRRRARRSRAICSWSAAGGTRRCTCSARPAAGSATTRRSGPSCPGRSSTAWPSPVPRPVCSTWPGAWPTGSGWPARR